MTRKTTQHDLVKVLTERNTNGKYNAIITRAANNGYHCFKFDQIPGHPEYGNCNEPKTQLVKDLKKFPELQDVMRDVINGMYDEPADAQDEQMMRGWLIKDNSPDKMFELLGLQPPTEAERKLKRLINN
jgi:hypothetical protein